MRHRKPRLAKAVPVAAAMQMLVACHKETALQGPDSVKRVCEQIAVHPEKARGMRAVIQLILGGNDGGNYYAAFENGSCTTYEGRHAAANATLTLAAEDFAAASECRVAAQTLFMEGRMKVEGDLGLMMKFFELLSCPPPAVSSIDTPTPAGPATSTPNSTTKVGSIELEEPIIRGGREPSVCEPTDGERPETADELRLKVQEIFDGLPSTLNADQTKGLAVVIEYNLSGPGKGHYFLLINDGACRVAETTNVPPDLTMTMSASCFVRMICGELNGQMAFMSGRLKIRGDMGLAMKMQVLFRRPEGCG